MILLTAIYFVFLVYAILIFTISMGWWKLKIFKSSSFSMNVRVSLVIALRNEEINIEQLLESIINQDYPVDFLEIVLVDDHSTDTTLQKLTQFANHSTRAKHLKVISLENTKYGKKAAISKGIEVSTGELIITTDADCTAAPTWISVIVNYFSIHKPEMILGPVRMDYTNSLFSKFQAFEFSSLLSTTAGSCNAGFPLMANGANLAYTRKAYEACGGFSGNQHFTSGDDMFMLMNIKKQFGRNAIQFLKTELAMINTRPVSGVKSLLNQRLRWVSKSRGYKDIGLIFSSILVFITNSLLVCCGVTAVFLPEYGLEFIQLLAFKSAIDFALLYSYNQFQKSTSLLWFFPLFEVFNAIYTFIIGIAGNVGGYNWKGRKSR